MWAICTEFNEITRHLAFFSTEEAAKEALETVAPDYRASYWVSKCWMDQGLSVPYEHTLDWEDHYGEAFRKEKEKLVLNAGKAFINVNMKDFGDLDKAIDPDNSWTDFNGQVVSPRQLGATRGVNTHINWRKA